MAVDCLRSGECIPAPQTAGPAGGVVSLMTGKQLAEMKEMALTGRDFGEVVHLRMREFTMLCCLVAESATGAEVA
jgi:hypothetical protein